MRVHHLSAVVAIALSSVLLTASCLQSPEANDTASSPSTIDQASERVDGAEPIGEAPQPMGRLPFGPTNFPFVVVTKWDGKDGAGGWQTTHFTLQACEGRGITPTYTWECPIEVGMAVQSRLEGRISTIRAAVVTAEIVNVAVPAQRASRDDWEGQGEVFCIELRERMNKMFGNAPYNGYGAKVTRWLP